MLLVAVVVLWARLLLRGRPLLLLLLRRHLLRINRSGLFDETEGAKRSALICTREKGSHRKDQSADEDVCLGMSGHLS